MKTRIFITATALLFSVFGYAQEIKETYVILHSQRSDATPKVEEGIVIYPNPSNGNFNIQLKGFTEGPELEIYNMDQERIVYQKKLDINRTVVRLGKLAKGIYVYRIYAPVDGNVMATGKLTFQ